MTHPHLSFKSALITGGGGGIGLALAQWLQRLGKKVIIAGRTESKLQEASSSSLQNCPYYVLDTGSVSSIPSFVDKITREHPDLDCLINNAGVQRPLDIVQGLDLSKADAEIDINIRGPLHLTIALLPHLRRKPLAVIVNVSSVLGFNPFAIVNPVYNGTKAWLHFWSLNLRSQLLGSGDEGTSNVKVVELVPPMVATDLHREREDPDDNKKEKNAKALSVEEFVDEVAGQWEEGRETIGAGMARGIVEAWEREFGGKYSEMVHPKGS